MEVCNGRAERMVSDNSSLRKTTENINARYDEFYSQVIPMGLIQKMHDHMNLLQDKVNRQADVIKGLELRNNERLGGKRMKPYEGTEVCKAGFMAGFKSGLKARQVSEIKADITVSYEEFYEIWKESLGKEVKDNDKNDKLLL